MIDPLTALAFSIYENKGVYCLLLGSGVSRPSEIPTGWEITLDLVRRVAALRGVTDEPPDFGLGKRPCFIPTNRPDDLQCGGSHIS